ncbi:hypothetical protein ACRAWD_19430 [Caulobacter segnis]
MKFPQDQAAERPTPGISIKWRPGQRTIWKGSGGIAIAFGLALLLVFLVLAAQFESWIHPAVSHA